MRGSVEAAMRKGSEGGLWGWPLEARRGPSPVSKKKNTETHSHYSRELSSANNHMSLEEDVELQKETAHLTPTLWDPKQRTQLYHTQTPDPWKLRSNKYMSFWAAKFRNSVIRVAIENYYSCLPKPIPPVFSLITKPKFPSKCQAIQKNTLHSWISLLKREQREYI